MIFPYNFVRATLTNVLNSNCIRNSLYRNIFKSVKLESQLNVNTNVIKDVILYKYDNPKFFKLLNIFALCQFGFWSYLSMFAYTNLRDAPVTLPSEAPWWKKINMGENKYRNSLAGFAFIVGYGILAISWMYTLRSVRYLILRKGGESVTFVTYSPFGTNRLMTVGLKNVSCQEMRSHSRSQLPLKVQNRMFYYIVDMKGEFRNTTLFDNTVGLKRLLKV